MPAKKLPTSFTSGPKIGVYKGEPIYEWLRDNHGVLRHYKGLFTGGGVAPGGMISTAGLVYEPAAE